MLIKKGKGVINLCNVTNFVKELDQEITFYFSFFINHSEKHENDEGSYCMIFASEEERDKAFEKILDCHQWQRTICDLDNL